jgi:hypothetical protein
MTYAKGIDVAYYDRRMGWSRYDWDFAYIKVSEGLVIDSEFHTHWQAAKGHTYRGGYHFARHFTDAKQSALKCIEFMDHDLGELPFWYDLEETNESPSVRRRIAEYAKSWLSWYEQETGVRPIIYTAQNIIYDLIAVADISWMSNYKLCLAQYRYDNLSAETRARILHQILTGDIAYSFPLPPSPFNKVTMVQWTGKGGPADVPGYYLGTGGKLAVDFDFYNGDRAAMIQEFGLLPLGDSPTQPPTETGVTMWYRVNTYKLQIRNGHGASYADIGDLWQNDKIEVVGAPVGGWLPIARIVRVNGDIEIPLGATWCSGAYCVLTASPLPAEPPVEPPFGLPDRLWIGATPETAAWYRKE